MFFQENVGLPDKFVAVQKTVQAGGVAVPSSLYDLPKGIIASVNTANIVVQNDNATAGNFFFELGTGKEVEAIANPTFDREYFVTHFRRDLGSDVRRTFSENQVGLKGAIFPPDRPIVWQYSGDGTATYDLTINLNLLLFFVGTGYTPS